MRSTARLLLLIVLMTLLPLRGWAGDSMAISMMFGTANHHATASAAETAHVVAPMAMDHANCAGQSGTVASTDKTTPAPDHCSTCPSCQACFTIGLIVPMVNVAAALPHTSLRHSSTVAWFASADLAHSQKPPIS
jgi:hypothetical protein